MAKKLSKEESIQLLKILEERFTQNMNRHKDISWSAVLARLEANKQQLTALYAMEATGGEPDVVALNKKTGQCIFFDCAAESPKERRSICYDRKALDARKTHKPANSAIGMANEMGIELLDEEQYLQLQQLGAFDLKTSSWLRTPDEVRQLGGAIFGDRRFNRVFIYHNGADSYYGARGFRGWIAI